MRAGRSRTSRCGTARPSRSPAPASPSASRLLVTDGLLPILRVEPAAGRRFTRDDDQPGAPDRLMLTHTFWQRKFGGDASAVGRTLAVDGRPYEIIGVLPASFRFLNRTPQIIVPMRFDRAKIFVGNFSYQGIARLKPGVTIEQANAGARSRRRCSRKFKRRRGWIRRWRCAPISDV